MHACLGSKDSTVDVEQIPGRLSVCRGDESLPASVCFLLICTTRIVSIEQAFFCAFYCNPNQRKDCAIAIRQRGGDAMASNILIAGLSIPLPHPQGCVGIYQLLHVCAGRAWTCTSSAMTARLSPAMISGLQWQMQMAQICPASSSGKCCILIFQDYSIPCILPSVNNSYVMTQIHCQVLAT